jgi:hypothetical protein
VGRSLRTLGLSLGRLDVDALLTAARRRTGLEDFGGDTFREPLRILVDSLEHEAALTTLGRIIARRMLLDLLRNRLQMQDWHRRHPEIAQGRIDRPIFVMGMARTGTTLLHDLLAEDPANRVPRSWEVSQPCPPPETASYASDPRIAQTDAQLAGTDRLIPEFKKMHPMGARLAQECVAITAHDFTSMLFTTAYRLPRYDAWLHTEADLAPVYASHRRQLQLLQWRCPGERWVLKSPGHLWAIEDLLAEYPDALLVQTHRDPVRIVASLTSLVAMLHSMTSEAVESREIAREWTGRVAAALTRSIEARESGLVPPGRIVDLQFRDLLADPVGAVKRIYDRFGLAYSAEAEAGARRFLAENPGDRHGTHTYRFADTGLDLEEERARFRPYCEYFEVPAEDLGCRKRPQRPARRSPFAAPTRPDGTSRRAPARRTPGTRRDP